jgi:hypothetical protein
MKIRGETWSLSSKRACSARCVSALAEDAPQGAAIKLSMERHGDRWPSIAGEADMAPLLTNDRVAELAERRDAGGARDDGKRGHAQAAMVTSTIWYS